MGYLNVPPVVSHPSMPSSPQGDVRGLVVPVGSGYERLVMTDQEICDDVLATIPKLKTAMARGTNNRRWKTRRRRNDVEMAELTSASTSGLDADDDPDIVHALVASTELKCHMNEVLNVLINQHSRDYKASMQALCGKKFQNGKVLFKQRRKFRFQGVKALPSHSSSGSRTSSEDGFSSVAALPQDGLVSVQTMSIRRKMPLQLRTKRRAAPPLAFASCTLQYPSKDRALHVIKTLPRAAHDQVVRPDDHRSPLRRGVDHIAMGIDIQSVHGTYSARSHSTRIFVYTYASSVPTTDYATEQDAIRRLSEPHDLPRRAIVNPEARHVMDVLTKSLRQYESVIRRRRFGFQSFAHFSMASSASSSANCHVCCKKFRFYRRDSFCQLCGNTVCSDCSQTYDVEARVGDVRRTRCCVQCVVRVDACVFDDEDLLAALGPAIVDANETAWRDDYPLLETPASSSSASISDFSASLSAQDPAVRSMALDKLSRIVRGLSTASTASSAEPASLPPMRSAQVLHEVESHIRQSVQSARTQYGADNCPVYGRQHDYAFAFGANGAAPLAPRPVAQKEASRLHHIQQSGVLSPTYDRAALDMLARLAATHLKCDVGYVSVIDAQAQHIIGAYNYPEAALDIPRDETLCMHGVYSETPVVLKNPRRDQRFAQLPVVKDHGLQFYAGFPIRAPDGTVVASLCASDSTPHANITTKDYATMKVLADLASELLVPRQK